ncbi:hypothetical protein C0Q70_06388 [Pomacea canaliculata]|uniref:Transient receptor ion channel domain-containing protein n=1 Tax=Pomacea canaliculata TaxID=400727 RepID=A0A2T7PP02_POMCA|nr:hypothetical protein C0Q70_06388 [Pomacea canaliculata]
MFAAWKGVKSGRLQGQANARGKLGRASMKGLSLALFADVEEEFLHAAEFGDIPTVRRLLNEFSDLNVDCIDALGRTALRLAVKNEHLEIVEVLLDRSSQHHIHEAVLQAISAGHIQIAETILKHRRYLELWKERRKLGDTDGFYKTAYAESQFSPDITPLILAAQKNQYEIVQVCCCCVEKRSRSLTSFPVAARNVGNKVKFDQLRLAKYRLNAFRGLASEAYISLSSKDPILSAFELGAELKRLSRVEKHFKREYRDLAEQLSDYTVKLLDRVRTQKELEMVLNKTGKANDEKYEGLARFQLALKYKEKKFVAHASCQQRVVRTWYSGMGKLQRAGWMKRSAMTSLFHSCYPFLVLLHLVAPGSKSSASVSSERNMSSQYRDAYKKYQVLYNDYVRVTNNKSALLGPDFPLRPSMPTATEIMMSLWILGMVFQECNQIFVAGAVDHMMNLFNLLDYMLLSVYTSVFSLRFWTMFKFHEGIAALTAFNETTTPLNDTSIEHSIYWLNADRMKWNKWDPINTAEGMFAIANILSFSRISYLLPANEYLGPLQISLGRMLKDIMKFMALFTMVILAFMVGLHNLFWYYSERDDIEVQYEGRPEAQNVKASSSFGGVMATFRTVFWSLFGRGEPDAVQLGNYNNSLTEDIGYIIYGVYNIVMVTVLINMLIAMMTRSFTNIAEDSDVEWKFARSLLYMEYIAEGGTLPPPLNIIGAPKAVLRALLCRCDCKGDGEGDQGQPDTNGTREQRNAIPLDETAASREGLSLEESSGRANPVEISAVDIYEGNLKNGVTESPRHVLVPLDSSEEELTYEKTMQRIIQRYIFDIQREAEVTEDDFEEIKQDILSFRFEVMNLWKTREALQDEISANIKTILQCINNGSLSNPMKRRVLSENTVISEEES